MESIGLVLRQERERRGLALQDVHDATRITSQNLSALEDDRFDYFPNRVYARAFLRDYANYLGLDSAELLARYEETWNSTSEVTPAPAPRRGSAWNVLGWVALVVVILASLGAAAYYGFEVYGKKPTPAVARKAPVAPRDDLATLPKAPSVEPAPAEPAPKAAPKPAPVVDKAVLEVTAVYDCWMRVKTDGIKAFEGILPKGQSRSFTGGNEVYIFVGKSNAVSLKFNGEKKPPLGSDSNPKAATFVKPPTKPTAASGSAGNPSEE